jgi:hypothetical protein
MARKARFGAAGGGRIMSDRDNPAKGAAMGTALVAVSNGPARKPHPRRPPGADPRFLAQLIALGHDLLSQRTRRRATPDVAVEAYRAAAALAPQQREKPLRSA